MKNTPFLHKPVMVLAQEFQSAITQDKAGSAEQSMLSLDYSAPPTNSLWQSQSLEAHILLYSWLKTNKP